MNVAVDAVESMTVPPVAMVRDRVNSSPSSGVWSDSTCREMEEMDCPSWNCTEPLTGLTSVEGSSKPLTAKNTYTQLY